MYKILFLINEELPSAKNISKKARNKICHKKPSIHIPILHIHSRPEKLGELVISSETWLINRVPYLQSTPTTVKPTRKYGHFFLQIQKPTSYNLPVSLSIRKACKEIHFSFVDPIYHKNPQHKKRWSFALNVC
jgi:hypothetical protein